MKLITLTLLLALTGCTEIVDTKTANAIQWCNDQGEEAVMDIDDKVYCVVRKHR